jgi:tetratricopeptide (TPR) repeat protein
MLYLLLYELSEAEGKLEEALKIIDWAIKSQVEFFYSGFWVISKIDLLVKLGRIGQVRRVVKKFMASAPAEGIEALVSSLVSDVISANVNKTIHLEIFHRVKALFPKEITIQRLNGWIELWSGNWKKAAGIYTTMLTEQLTEDTRLEFLNNLACARLKENKLEAAEKVFTEVIQADSQPKPNYLPYWLWTFIYRDGELESFVTEYPPDKADPEDLAYCDIDPTLAAKANLAALALSHGDTGQAAKLAGELIAAKPQESLGYAVLGSVALVRGERQTAMDLWRVGAQMARGYYLETIEKWLTEIQSSNDGIKN